MQTNDDLNKKLLELCPEGAKIYIVGGYIRDILLGRECFDRDYTVKGTSAIEFAKKAAGLVSGSFVLLDKEHDIARVVMPDKLNTLDFAGCVGTDIYSDLANRDYVLNAMACRLQKDGCDLIDPFCGKQDIENRIVRVIGEQNLIDDPLRLVRAFRMAAQFDFIIEEKTLELIKKHAGLINNVAMERVNTELMKMLSSGHAARNLILMKNTGLLFEIFPELTPQREVPPNRHHHLWLIDHSIETVRNIEKNIRDFPIETQQVGLLKLAALLHDLGKPATWSIDDEGRHRFIKHEEVGSEMIPEVLKRLRFSKKDIRHVSMLVKNHLYPSQLIREGVETLSDKALMRFLRKIGEHVPELLILAMGDRLSARGPEITEEIVEKNVSGIYALLDRFEKASEEVKHIPKLASGEDVMRLRGLPKGPEVGKVLKALREAQIPGDVNTREEALAFINNYVPQQE